MDRWNQLPQTVGKSVSESLAELRTQIQEIHDFADDRADVEQQRYTDQYNKRAVDKHFQVGQQVIVLIPTLQINFWVDGKDRGQLYL